MWVKNCAESLILKKSIHRSQSHLRGENNEIYSPPSTLGNNTTSFAGGGNLLANRKECCTRSLLLPGKERKMVEKERKVWEKRKKKKLTLSLFLLKDLASGRRRRRRCGAERLGWKTLAGRPSLIIRLRRGEFKSTLTWKRVLCDVKSHRPFSFYSCLNFTFS